MDPKQLRKLPKKSADSTDANKSSKKNYKRKDKHMKHTRAVTDDNVPDKSKLFVIKKSRRTATIGSIVNSC